MRTPLCEIAERHGTNKAFMGYTPHYYHEFAYWSATRVLEIGIGGPGLSGGPSEHGAGLKMWREFFPYATIVGIDNNVGLLFEDERITTYVGDVMDPDTVVQAAALHGGYDLIVDDAVHDPEVQINLFHALRPLLNPGGTYAIEDVCPWKVDVEKMMEALVGGSADRARCCDGAHGEKLILVVRGA